LDTPTQAPRGQRNLRVALALCGAAVAIAIPAAPAQAGTGGTGTSTTSGTTSTSGSTSDGCKGTGKATLDHGKAIPPCDAPSRIVGVIDAANEIRKKPYVYGGGHSKFRASGYDCSGAVSYALHGGRFLRSPLDSSGLMRWARRGKGDWLTVFANPGHAFMVVAGLRWDTSMVPGDGPGWSSNIRAEPWRQYKKRHKGLF
jgi:cell wall-associated NlpC family hydrolase